MCASTSISCGIHSRTHWTAALGDQEVLRAATGGQLVHAIGGLRALYGAIACRAVGMEGHVRPTAAAALGRWCNRGKSLRNVCTLTQVGEF